MSETYYLVHLVHLKPVRHTMDSHNAQASQDIYLLSGEGNLLKTIEQHCEESFSARMQLPRERNEEGSLSNNVSVNTIIDASPAPSIIKRLGPYDKIESHPSSIMTDLRLVQESAIDSIAGLFAGSIVSFQRQRLLVLTAEFYPKATSVDIHAESSGASIPLNKSAFVVKVIDASDGGQLLKRLVIGFSQLNVLVTSSVLITPSGIEVLVGPRTTLPNLANDNCEILVRREAARRNQPSLSLNCLRQITTGFASRSTYKLWRATVKEFDHTMYQPATIFTLCDLPATKYGFSPKSLASLSSQILQKLAAIHIKNGLITKEDFANISNNFACVLKTKKNTKSWKTAIGLLESLTNVNNMDCLEFATDNLDTTTNIAKDLSAPISTANKQIAKNIKNIILELYHWKKALLLSFDRPPPPTIYGKSRRALLQHRRSSFGKPQEYNHTVIPTSHSLYIMPLAHSQIYSNNLLCIVSRWTHPI